MNILSVDDSKIIRNVIRGAVDVLGYDFFEACDGVEALEILESMEEKIDLILLDWNMPNMDGLTFLKKIKQDDRFSAIPVIMVTTEVDRNRVIEAIQEGARNYVMKPFSQEDLIAKIMESLGLGV